MGKKKKPATSPIAAMTPPDDLSPIEQLSRAYATGNGELVRRVREQLGLSAPPVYRDALRRVSKVSP